MNLNAEFRTFIEGDLFITDYCCCLKTMANTLANVGEPVLDRTLVLTVLRRLNKQFGCMAASSSASHCPWRWIWSSGCFGIFGSWSSALSHYSDLLGGLL